MAEFSKLVITGKGQALLAKAVSGTGNVEFTKVCSSDTVYPIGELEALTGLENIVQTSLISKIERTNEVAVKVEAAFSNTELTAGYYMRALGLYATDPDDGEILYAVTAETSGNCYMPPYNGVTVSGAFITLITTIGNSENVELEVNPAAVATIGDLKSIRQDIAELQAAANHGGVSSASIVIPSTAAVWNQSADGGYVDIPVEGVTASMIPIVSVAESDSGTASKCGLSSKVETLDGAVRFRAKRTPETDITAELTLLVTSGSISGGLSGDSAKLIEELSASDSDVQEVINGIFVNQK